MAPTLSALACPPWYLLPAACRAAVPPPTEPGAGPALDFLRLDRLRGLERVIPHVGADRPRQANWRIGATHRDAVRRGPSQTRRVSDLGRARSGSDGAGDPGTDRPVRIGLRQTGLQGGCGQEGQSWLDRTSS